MLIKDQIGHELLLKESPKRIISLVPSQTELLYDLGLGERVVGITKFCIHPNEWFTSKSRVGGTKTIDYNKINNLSPDLIIANKEENEKEQIEHLQTLYPVYTSNINDLDDSLIMINDIATITHSLDKANVIIDTIKKEFNALDVSHKTVKVLYLIWRDPYMTIGSNTFINSMIQRCGFENVITEDKRYPEIDTNTINIINPDYIFLSSEPYPFKEKHFKEIKNIFPKAEPIIVDGEFFSWYGSRLMKAPAYFNSLINKIT